MASMVENDRIYTYHVIENFEIRGDNRSSGCWTPSSVKLVQLCCIWILFPIIWIVVPLYLRLFLYAKSEVPLSFTGMRLLDTNISTIWCQAQVIQMNNTFDAYLLNFHPPKAQETISMVRTFELDDDLKEYWGVYLLENAEISVASCSKQLGAYLTIVKGDSETKHFNCIEEQSTDDNHRPTYKDYKFTKNISHSKDAGFGTSNLNPPNNSLLNLGHEVDENENQALEDEDPLFIKSNKELQFKDLMLDHGIFAHPLAADDSVSQDSSISSSEEMLKNCENTVLHKPLIPTQDCPSNLNSTRNLVRFKAPEEGYYYFVFSSTYEVGKNQSNPLGVMFELLKPEFNVANATYVCLNSTRCHFHLTFGSSEKIVVDLSSAIRNATPSNGQMLENIYILESECVPRSSVYLIFGLTLPLALILCAFI